MNVHERMFILKVILNDYHSFIKNFTVDLGIAFLSCLKLYNLIKTLVKLQIKTPNFDSMHQE